MFAVDNRFSLRIPKMDPKSIRIIDYSDPSFANNDDPYTQLGYVYIIRGNTSLVIVISFKSENAMRETKSAVAKEISTFSDLFDVAAVLAVELS